MIFLPISNLATAGFYYSASLFFLSSLLLVALYCVRWKLDRISLGLWLTAIVSAAVASWFLTNDTTSISTVLGINFIILLLMCRLTPKISLFGVFFLASMLFPSVFGLLWLFEITKFAHNSLNAGWFIDAIIWIAWGVFSILTIFNSGMLGWVMLVRYSSLYFRFPRVSEAWNKTETSLKTYPWVSIHLPCYNEPPEMVIETLNALAHLQYPNFEVIVLDNNTKDSTIWKPVENHCLNLGKQFRFYHIEKLSGAKAGALNMCLELTSPQAEIIGVIDADYVAQPDFLDQLVSFFDDNNVGFVQSCQDYRNWRQNAYQSACYFEYENHFKLEMPGQNEWDAAYTIGTMCLIRRKVLEQVGGWAEWCLTEDSEVAVRIHALGYAGYYLKNSFGHGLIPETFENYKRQRFRWSAGPVQQFQKHWRLYLPWHSKGQLTPIQKYSEIVHSLATVSTELLNLLLNIPFLAVCLWCLIAKGVSFKIPFAVLFTIPVLILKNIICNWLSVKLMGGRFKDYLLSAMAARSLIFTRYSACLMALTKRQLQWKRTDKFKTSTNFMRAWHSSSSEIILTLIYSALGIVLTYFANFQHPDILFLIWLGIVNRSLSFLCAPIMALLSEKNLDSSH